jgi:hypothetical protein
MSVPGASEGCGHLQSDHHGGGRKDDGLKMGGAGEQIGMGSERVMALPF